MKYLKMLGLAALAVMGLMAIVGAGTASATKLCEQNTEAGCTSHVLKGWTLAFEHEGTTTLTGPFGEVIDKCTLSLIEGSTTTTGSATETVKVNITTLAFGNCDHPITSQNTSGISALGTLEVHKIASSKNGTVTSNGTTVTIPETIFGTCHFLTSNTDIGTLRGKDDASNTTPGTPTLLISAKIPSENCGFSGTWEGSYSYTGTTPFNVSAS